MGTMAVDDPCPNCGSDNFDEPTLNEVGVYSWHCQDCCLTLDDYEWMEVLHETGGYWE